MGKDLLDYIGWGFAAKVLHFFGSELFGWLIQKQNC